MKASELRRIMVEIADDAHVLACGVEVAQAVVTTSGDLILEMDPEYQHEGVVIWTDPGVAAAGRG